MLIDQISRWRGRNMRKLTLLHSWKYCRIIRLLRIFKNFLLIFEAKYRIFKAIKFFSFFRVVKKKKLNYQIEDKKKKRRIPSLYCATKNSLGFFIANRSRRTSHKNFSLSLSTFSCNNVKDALSSLHLPLAFSAPGLRDEAGQSESKEKRRKIKNNDNGISCFGLPTEREKMKKFISIRACENMG